MADITKTIVDSINTGLDVARGIIGSEEFSSTIDFVKTTINSALVYQDGVSETRYGTLMERSWAGNANSFLYNIENARVRLDAYEVSISENTPLDPGRLGDFNLYGNLMLGTPPLFTHITDPNNRTMINTFVKDATFLSLTPGMPKFNGGAFSQGLRSLVTPLVTSTLGAEAGAALSAFGDYTTQTPTANEAFDYLLKNGIDPDFAAKDRRYYTFQAKYNDYYSYLETMLNTLWIKMGLGTEGDGKFNIYSFFNPGSGSNYSESLKDRYKSSLGFYVTPAVSEMATNSELASDLGERANAASAQFQRLNYLTGMGTDAVGAGRRLFGVIKEEFKIFQGVAQDFDQSGSNILTKLGGFMASQDLSAVVQAFATTNGMRVVYPNLWSDSSYSKSMNFSFNFVSPYGDPLSIFQYVYVPFFALLTFALPRQAAENGYVSPFFVRADVPGLITSDLAMITDINWVKGGDGNLFTKDKLPRAISGSFTVSDLYPYLSMVKRLSFMSSNPSYTVFLDNMAGLYALYNEGDSNPMNFYWKQLINRISGDPEAAEVEKQLWNDFSRTRKSQNAQFSRTTKRSVTKTTNLKSVPWMSKI